MTTIPAEAVLRLREALYFELGDAAEQLATVTRRPRADGEQHDEWAQTLGRFDHTRAALDELGWVQRDPERDAEIDLDRHRQVIVDALTEALESERYLMNEQGADAEQQRQRAYARAVTIETWAASVGLEVK